MAGGAGCWGGVNKNVLKVITASTSQPGVYEKDVIVSNLQRWAAWYLNCVSTELDCFCFVLFFKHMVWFQKTE